MKIHHKRGENPFKILMQTAGRIQKHQPKPQKPTLPQKHCQTKQGKPAQN